MFIFTKVNSSSDQVWRIAVAFRKQFLKPFGLYQPEAFLLPSSELNGHPTRITVARFSGFFFLFIYLFDGQFRLFSFSDSNTYSDAEISIISFTFWWTRNNFGVIFSFAHTLFALFTFHVLVAYGGPSRYI